MKRWFWSACAVVVSVTLIPVVNIVAVEPETDSAQIGQPIESAEQALDLAARYTGLHRVIDMSDKSAESVCRKSHNSLDAPRFVRSLSSSNTTWVVTYEEVPLNLTGWMPSVIDNQIPKTYDVYLDSASGVLLGIITRFEGDESDSRTQRALVADSLVSESILENFKDVINGPPPTDFLRALDVATVIDPIKCKQLVAICVKARVASLEGISEREVWVIIGIGGSGFDRISSPGYGRTSTNWKGYVETDSGVGLMFRGLPDTLEPIPHPR